MRGLLIVLCAIGALSGIVTGTCSGGLIVFGVAQGNREAAAIGLFLLGVAVVVTGTNRALVRRLLRNEPLPRDQRTTTLASVDLLLAFFMGSAAAAAGGGAPDMLAALIPAVALFLKGYLILSGQRRRDTADDGRRATATDDVCPPSPPPGTGALPRSPTPPTR